MAGSSLFQNLARAAKVLALLLFLMPWVTVSCSPQAASRASGAPESAATSMPVGAESIPVARATGLQLATGGVQLVTAGLPQREGANSRQPVFTAEIGVIAGAALIVLALVGGFLLKGAAGMIAGIGGSVLAIAALCYSVFIHFPPAVREALAATASGESAPNAEQIAQIIQVKAESGFYLTLALLLAAVVLNVMAMRKTGVAPAAVAAQPPAEPPAAA